MTLLSVTLFPVGLSEASVRYEPQPNPDPIANLPANVQQQFECIAFHESRGKTVDTNSSSGTQGLYQFQVWLWQWARSYVPNEPSTPNQATRLQQDKVAYFFYRRNGGFYPEWASEKGLCW